VKGRVTHMEEKEKKKPSILILSRKPFVAGELVPWICSELLTIARTRAAGVTLAPEIVQAEDYESICTRLRWVRSSPGRLGYTV